MQCECRWVPHIKTQQDPSRSELPGQYPHLTFPAGSGQPIPALGSEAFLECLCFLSPLGLRILLGCSAWRCCGHPVYTSDHSGTKAEAHQGGHSGRVEGSWPCAAVLPGCVVEEYIPTVLKLPELNSVFLVT